MDHKEVNPRQGCSPDAGNAPLENGSYDAKQKNYPVSAAGGQGFSFGIPLNERTDWNALLCEMLGETWNAKQEPINGETTGQSVLQAALELATSGKPGFPCGADKRPLTMHGFKDASTDPEQIRLWWKKWPDALIGIPTGTKTGIFVLDVDMKNGKDGEGSLAALEAKYGKLPETKEVRTRSGGRHLYFFHEDGISNSVEKIGEGLDIRGEGGCVIVPPSPGYAVIHDMEPAKAPEWLINLIKQPKHGATPQQSERILANDEGTPYGKAALDGILDEMRTTPEGQRNDTLNRLSFRIGQLVSGGKLPESAGEQLKAAARETGLPPEDVERTFDSGYKSGLKNPFTWEEPDSLVSKIEPIQYPLDSLPDSIREAVCEVQAFVQAPESLVVSCALSAVSLALQPHVDVQREKKLTSPSSLFLLTIADSGERKTTTDGFFIQVIHEWEKKQRAKLEPEIKEYETCKAAWNAQKSGIEGRIKKLASEKKKDGEHDANLKAAKEELKKLSLEIPIRPKIPQLLYQDATPEALAFSLAHNWPFGSIISSEAGIVFGSHAMNNEIIMRNIGQLNTFWDGVPLKIDRRGSESFTVSEARLTIALQVQEATLREFFKKNGILARGSGFLARFLIAWPESTQGTRLFKKAPEGFPALEKFHERIKGILNESLPVLMPRMLTMSPEAQDYWIKFHDSIEKELADNGDFYDIRDVAAKCADNAARLSVLFHAFDYGFDSKIGLAAMESGSDIALWHLNEARRFFGELAVIPEILDAGRLEAWMVVLCKKDGVQWLPRRKIQQCGPVRDPKRFEAALNILTDYKRAKLGIIGKQKAIFLNPEILTESELKDRQQHL